MSGTPTATIQIVQPTPAVVVVSTASGQTAAQVAAAIAVQAAQDAQSYLPAGAIVAISQAAYSALATPNPAVLYLITS